MGCSKKIFVVIHSCGHTCRWPISKGRFYDNAGNYHEIRTKEEARQRIHQKLDELKKQKCRVCKALEGN